MARIFLLAALSLLLSFAGASAAEFKNGPHRVWADTPKGKFECLWDKTTEYRQLLKLGGKVIYKEPAVPPALVEYAIEEGCGEAPLTQGIYMASRIAGACPKIIANQDGFLVLERQFSPLGSQGDPGAGIFGVAVVNFNLNSPTLTELVDLQTTPHLQLKRDLVWDQKGMTMSYFGYPYNVPGGTDGAPKPAMHKVRFDFSSCSVSPAD